MFVHAVQARHPRSPAPVVTPSAAATHFPPVESPRFLPSSTYKSLGCAKGILEMIKEHLVMLYDEDAADEKCGVSDAMYIADLVDIIDTMESIIGSHDKGLMYAPSVGSDPLADLNIQALNMYLDCVTGKVATPVPAEVTNSSLDLSLHLDGDTGCSAVESFPTPDPAPAPVLKLQRPQHILI
jgi:hypothetical protein